MSPTTIRKIEAGEKVRSDKTGAIEKALGMPIGSIRAFQKNGTLPDIPDTTVERRIEASMLEKGEKLYEVTTEYGVKYRLEISAGYGASYTWPSPRPLHEIIPHLRKLSALVATAGGLIDTE